MAAHVLTDAKLWVSGFDVSGDANRLAVAYGAEAVDDTRFGMTVRSNAGGLKTLALQCEGFWDADGTDEPDDVFFSRVGTSGVPVSFAAEGGDAGDVGYCFESLIANYAQRGQIGEMYAFVVDASANNGAPLVRGMIAFNAAVSGASGAGTAYNIGAVSATQRAYASLHVLAIGAGTSLGVIVKSDDAQAFSSPTNRISFTAATTIGGQFSSAAGAITDSWWRADWTLTGGTTTATFVVVVGIK